MNEQDVHREEMETLKETSWIEKLAKGFKIIGKWMVTNEGSRTASDRKELVEKVFEAMYGDLGHYGKDTTDLLYYGLEILDACIPCQLFKHDNNTPVTASLHPFGTEYGPFEFWEIDFVGPWIKTPSGNSYQAPYGGLLQHVKGLHISAP